MFLIGILTLLIGILTFGLVFTAASETTEIILSSSSSFSSSESFHRSEYATETIFYTILQSVEPLSTKPTFSSIEESVKYKDNGSTISSSLSVPLSDKILLTSSETLESTPTTVSQLNQCVLECCINVSFAMKKNSTQLGNQINEVLSYEFKNNNIKNYLYLIFLKLSAQTNTSVTYWFDLIFQRPYCNDILKQEVLEKSKQLFGKTVNDYTIIPNSLQIKPFEIPPSRNKLLSFEMKLEENFNKELKDKSSEEFKILEYKIIRILTFFLESIRGFVKVIINDFEEGSIVVKAQLLFDSDEVKFTNEEIKRDIEIKLIRYLGLLNDTINNYKVDINSFKINGDILVLKKSNTFPVWAIVLIVLVLVMIPIIFICLRQKKKIRKLKTALKISTNMIQTAVELSQSNVSCDTSATKDVTFQENDKTHGNMTVGRYDELF